MLLVLSVFDGLLDELAELVGIQTPANALFAVGFGFIMVLLLAFSSVISRLSRENKLMAQELARLNRERERERSPAAPARELESDREESPIPK